MKKSCLLSLALAAAAMLPLAAAAQIAPDRPAKTTDEPAYKWKAYAGMGYSALNQVNGSRYALFGVTGAATRNFGRFFGLTAQGSYYTWPAHTGQPGNPGDPSVSEFLAGPELHVPLLDKWSLFGHGLIGGVHTGGNNQRPGVSFAGGGGGGLDYQINDHFGIRAFGDTILASFTVINPAPGDSPHMSRNAHASVGVTYRF